MVLALGFHAQAINKCIITINQASIANRKWVNLRDEMKTRGPRALHRGLIHTAADEQSELIEITSPPYFSFRENKPRRK